MAKRVTSSRPGAKPTMESLPVAPPQGLLPDLGPGRPLDPETRERLEPHLGQGLEDVQIHTGTQADNAARSVEARAFTVGRDIVFGADRYEPGTREGLSLLAHEATHVAQQAAAGAPAVQRAEETEEDSRKAKEAKASDVGKAVAQSEPVKKITDDFVQKFQQAPLGEKIGAAAGVATVAGGSVAGALANPEGRKQLHGVKLPIPGTPVSVQPLGRNAPLTFDPHDHSKPGPGTPTGLGGMLHVEGKANLDDALVKLLSRLKKLLPGR